ncbi:hypothetical protein [Kutzneria sp. 744]|uniref:hypothetical protein n=1 Tax=Kutzneria sp. (strain 744) TaxID=345341 RepID=UPI0004B87604|nr:hypothetical protein [Kutzneria sp. 744]
MRVIDLKNEQAGHSFEVDAAIVSTEHWVVVDRHEQAVGTVKIQRELFIPVRSELMASSLRQCHELGKRGCRHHLVEP